MRGWLVLAGAVLLAGCGNDEDFYVSVAMAPGAAQSELARLDGGDLIQMSTIQALSPTSEGDKLVYVLHGDGESGELVLRFEEVGPNRTRIHVAVTVPGREFKSGGHRMVVDEMKVEQELRSDLQEWAKGVREHGYASLTPMNETLGSVILLLNVDSDSEEDIAALISPEFLDGAGEPGEPQFAAADDAAEPMMDSDAGTDAAGRPMDEASGDEADGYDPNVASEPESLAYDSGY